MDKSRDRKVLYEIHKLRFDRDDDYVDAVLATLNRFNYNVYPDSWVDVNNPKSSQNAFLKKIDVYTPSAIFKNYSVAERRARLYYRAWAQCNMALAAFSFTEERRAPDVWFDAGQFVSTFNMESCIKGVDATLDVLWTMFAKPESIRKYGLRSLHGYPGRVPAIEWNYHRMKNALKIALKASPKDDNLPEYAKTFGDLINNTTMDCWYEEVCGVKSPAADVPLLLPGVPGPLPDEVYIGISIIPYAGEGTVELTKSAKWYLEAHVSLPAPLGPVKGKAPSPKPNWMQGTAFHRSYLDFTKRLNSIAMKLWRRYVNTKIPKIDSGRPIADPNLIESINRASRITGFGTSFPFCGTFAAQVPENFYIHLAACLFDMIDYTPSPVNKWIKAHDIPTMFEVREWYLLYKKYKSLYESTSDDRRRDLYRAAYKSFLGKYRQGMRKIILAKKKLAEGLTKMVSAYRKWKRLIEEFRIQAYNSVVRVAFLLRHFIRSVKLRVQRWAAWRRFCLVTCYNIGVKRLIRARNLVDESLALRRAYEHIVRRKREVRLTPKVNAEKTFPKNTREDFYNRFVKLLFKATLSTHFLKFEDDPNNFERWEFDIVIGGAYPLRKPKLDLSKWPPKGMRPKDLEQALKECSSGLKPPDATMWGKSGGELNWSGIFLHLLLNDRLNGIASEWEKNLWSHVRRERAKIKASWSANPLRELDVPLVQGEYLVRKFRG